MKYEYVRKNEDLRSNLHPWNTDVEFRDFILLRTCGYSHRMLDCQTDVDPANHLTSGSVYLA